MSEIRIGTSGWVYKHWQNRFYPSEISQKNWLQYYSSNFDTVEINSTFYRLQRSSTFKKWYTEVGDDFVFSVKASRYITHIKRLKIESDSLDKLLNGVAELKEKTGPVLFQLPPNLKFNRKEFEAFLDLLPADFRFVIEPRHESWFTEYIYKLLSESNVCLCIINAPGLPVNLEITSDFVFVRMHGSELLYNSSYTEPELRDWAARILEWKDKHLDCYIYFNNDAFAFATHNALRLKELVSGRLGRAAA